MEKRITNVFDYSSYQLLLADDFAKRVAFNNSYSLRSYANDVGVSVSHLSKVINRKQDFTPQTGRIVFKSLGLADDELEFVEDLIELNTTKEYFKKAEIQLKLVSKYNKTNLSYEIQNQLPHTKSAVNFFTYGMLRDLTCFSDLYKMTDQIGLSREDVSQAVNELSADGFVVVDGESLLITEKDFSFVRGHDNFSEFAIELSKVVYGAYLMRKENNVKDNSASTLVLGYDEQSIQEVFDLQKHYILTLLKISERCLSPDRYVFLSNLFVERTIEP